MQEFMIVRYKLGQTRAEGPSWVIKNASLSAYSQPSSQELELSNMHLELEQSRPVLRALLLNCPESVRSLLDSCVVGEEGSGMVTFDCFLFEQQTGDQCELAVIDLVSSTPLHPSLYLKVCTLSK